MANYIHQENFCKINGRIIHTNATIVDTPSSISIDTKLLYAGSVAEIFAFYNNANATPGKVSISFPMNDNARELITTVLTTPNGDANHARVNLETAYYSGLAVLARKPENVSNNADVTLEFLKLSATN